MANVRKHPYRFTSAEHPLLALSSIRFTDWKRGEDDGRCSLLALSWPRMAVHPPSSGADRVWCLGLRGCDGTRFLHRWHVYPSQAWWSRHHEFRDGLVLARPVQLHSKDIPKLSNEEAANTTSNRFKDMCKRSTGTRLQRFGRPENRFEAPCGVSTGVCDTLLFQYQYGMILKCFLAARVLEFPCCPLTHLIKCHRWCKVSLLMIDSVLKSTIKYLRARRVKSCPRK